MISHMNHLLADDSREIHTLFFSKIRKYVAKFVLSSAAVDIDALRVNCVLDQDTLPTA